MNKIEKVVNDIQIIDGHEHIDMFSIRKKRGTDFFKTIHYLESDLITAGMPRDILFSNDLPDEKKVNIFLEYWEKTKNTTYAKVVDIYSRDLYHLKDWTTTDVLEMNEKVKVNTEDIGWFKKVINEKSNIERIITLAGTTDVDFSLFRPILFMDFLFRLHDSIDVNQLCDRYEMPVKCFKDYLRLVDQAIKNLIDEGIVGIKLGHAYWRTLYSEIPSFREAEIEFEKLMNDKISSTGLKVFQDYIINFLIQEAMKYELPIQIHTGHQETSVSRNGNDVTNSKVTDLIPLLAEYPDAKFVLLHNGIPYHQEYLSVVKNYANTYVDFTWSYIISESLGKQLLHQTLEMVPINKILAFGGDFNSVEGIYAHQKIARKIISEVLTEKIEYGNCSEPEAIEFAQQILRDNYFNLYRL